MPLNVRLMREQVEERRDEEGRNWGWRCLSCHSCKEGQTLRSGDRSRSRLARFEWISESKLVICSFSIESEANSGKFQSVLSHSPASSRLLWEIMFSIKLSLRFAAFFTCNLWPWFMTWILCVAHYHQLLPRPSTKQYLQRINIIFPVTWWLWSRRW